MAALCVPSLLTALTIHLTMYFGPFNVTYDDRALIIGGKHRILVSAGIHYPRATLEYNFEGRYDIVKFAKLVGSLYSDRVFPVWLRDIPGIELRTDNAPLKMERYVRKIVDLMIAESLFSWQGGPIILLQIENEYENIEISFDPKGKIYMKWAAEMAVGLGAGVPWVMCRQTGAPEYIVMHLVPRSSLIHLIVACWSI
ncbi:Beta-galactosidase 9 [Capsicum baccatum]|uniref:beta-galactosidase n=1 Tax=Capsicum baccatum TaxID=33114 RepID=A0A2G2WXI8_CAPBA|nr:Beta-galactosidase 9 [Capsicum baccatum]